MRKSIIILAAFAALMLAVGCAGTPANVSPAVQGAQTLTGQQGQAAETGSATNYANPIILNFFGKKLTLRTNPGGEVVVEGEGGDEPIEISGSLTTGSVTYGEDAARAEVSSGGGSQAGTSGGQGGGNTRNPDEGN